MLLILVILALIGLVCWYHYNDSKLPAGDNVLTDAEALAMDAGDAVEKEISKVIPPHGGA